MKKLIILMVFFLGIFSCNSIEYIITENGNLNIYQTEEMSVNDTIRKPFVLDVEFETMQFSNNFNFMQTANAFKYYPTYINSIDLNSIQVTLDRDMIIDNKTIKPGENIIKDNYDEFYRNNAVNFFQSPRVNVYFNEQLLNKMKFEKGWTTFTFSGVNSDGIRFSFDKKVYMDFK